MSASSSPSRALEASFISSVMQQPRPACRPAKGILYIWSQSTRNSIILERVSCVSSTERLFTCAEPRCYFASPSVFIMTALFFVFWRRWRWGGVAANTPRLHPVSLCPDVASVALSVRSLYALTPTPDQHPLLCPFAPPQLQPAECRFACVCVFVYIYCKECCLNRTCQTRWNNPGPPLCFFPSKHRPILS